MGTIKFYLLVVTAITLLLLFGWVGYRLLPESAPVARGAEYAEVRGCVECHGDPKNPQLDKNDRNCSNMNKFSWHPEYEVACIDVIAYFETVRLRRSIGDRMQINSDNPLIAGERLVRKYNCFQCHGKLGQGGFKNTNSLKGYIPGYFGNDFKMLTNNADPESVREWITHGVDKAIIKKPITGRIAEFFLQAQAVSMPSFNSLEPNEIETLVNYVIAIHKFGPMTADTVRLYDERSRTSLQN